MEIMTANANITDERTPFPAPTYYGADEFGHSTKFYKPEWVEHAQRLHDGRKSDNPDVSAFKLATPNVGIRIVPFTGDPAQIPTKGKKACSECGELFTPIVAKQITCSPACSTKRNRDQKLAYYHRQKSKVTA